MLHTPKLQAAGAAIRQGTDSAYAAFVAAHQLIARNPARVIAFWFVLGMFFVRFSLLHEVVAFKLGVNTYVLYALAPFAVGGVLMTGGLGRVFRYGAALLWLCVLIWMVLGIPFSVWPGGSINTVKTYARSEWLMLIVAGGVGYTWKECRRMVHTIALSCLGCVLGAQMLMTNIDDRTSLDFGGSIANSNDLAAHLILVSPILLFVISDSKIFSLFRLGAFGLLGFCVYLILSSASRGALLACVTLVLFYFWRATSKHRMVMLLLVPVGVIGLFAALPERTLNRMLSFSNSATADAEALASSEARSYLLKTSIYMTVTHPVFGVGAGQFSSAESDYSKVQGRRANWHETHNVYTQISSETGIPGVIFFLGGIIATFRLLNQSFKKTRARKDCQDMAQLCLCVMLSFTGFCVAITFLTMGYRFYLPAFAGMAIMIHTAVNNELRLRQGPLAAATLEASPVAANVQRPLPIPAVPAAPAGRVGWTRMR